VSHHLPRCVKDVRKFTAEVGLPFTVLLDKKGAVRERYGLIAVPTSIFIDSAGVMRMINSGPISRSARVYADRRANLRDRLVNINGGGNLAKIFVFAGYTHRF
jgi:hypothetical protein